jgi:integrase/recombinase XerD
VDVPLSTRTALATRDELFSANEQLALAGYLAGYSGLTRDAYTLDLRQYVAWCTEHRVAVFGARRASSASPATSSPWAERGPRSPASFARWLASTATPNRKASSRSRRRRMCGDPAWTTSPTPPASIATRSAPVGRRRVGRRRDHALISLLALNGLRVSEALGADIEDLGLERGHRTLTILRKGGKGRHRDSGTADAQGHRPGGRRALLRADRPNG